MPKPTSDLGPLATTGPTWNDAIFGRSGSQVPDPAALPRLAARPTADRGVGPARGLIWQPRMMNKAVLLSLLAAACSKSSADDAKAAAPAVAIDAAAVSALVPAELKAKLVFEKTDGIEERGRAKVTYTVAAPKGWKQDMKGFASLKGTDDVGFMTSFQVGSNCDGTCEPKDWAKVADKVNFAQFADAKVVRNDVTPTSRLLIAERGDSAYVMYAWWSDGARKYHTCMASLEQPVKAAAPAFAKACQAVAIAGDD